MNRPALVLILCLGFAGCGGDDDRGGSGGGSAANQAPQLDVIDRQSPNVLEFTDETLCEDSYEVETANKDFFSSVANYVAHKDYRRNVVANPNNHTAMTPRGQAIVDGLGSACRTGDETGPLSAIYDSAAAEFDAK